MPRKRVTTGSEPPQGTTRSRATAKTARTRRAKTTARTEAPRKRVAAAKTARPQRVRPAEPVRGTNHNNHGNGVAPGKTARDYAEAKRALSALWDDITKQTYSTFDTITQRVEKRYEGARKHVTQGDVKYALDKTQVKLKSLTSSGSQTVSHMAKQARLLYEMLRDAMAGKFKMPWVTVSAITAALLYLASPLDIIPDFIPGIGWLDDALVIALAVSVTRVDMRRYLAENHIDAAEYGL